MQPEKIKQSSLKYFPSISLIKQKIGKWLGRFWTIFSKTIAPLIDRIKKVAEALFYSSKKNQNYFSKKRLIEQHKITSEEPKIKKVNELVPFTASSAGNDSSFSSSAPLTSEDSYLKSESESKQNDFSNKRKNDLEKEKKVQTNLVIQNIAKIQKGKESPNSLKRMQARRSLLPTVNVDSKIKKKLFDAGGEGDCQLLAILAGLKSYYPDLKYKHFQLNELDSQKLRKIGIRFAREQMNAAKNHSNETYTIEVLGYIDSDRKEYNESIWEREGIIKRQALYNLQLKKEQMEASEFYRKMIEIKNLYEKKCQESIIDDDETFLKELEKKDFYCSTLHLFALSLKFKIPIHVRDEKGVKNHKVQIFNPSNSFTHPIKLYRSKNHYQLIIN